jgi:signal transduction histidine kinase
MPSWRRSACPWAVKAARSAAFHVEDSGAGIPEAARERLFEPFFTTRGEGSGLGLAIVRQVAEVHGGWVEWSQRAEGGSRFSLYLPFASLDRRDG